MRSATAGAEALVDAGAPAGAEAGAEAGEAATLGLAPAVLLSALALPQGFQPAFLSARGIRAIASSACMAGILVIAFAFAFFCTFGRIVGLGVKREDSFPSAALATPSVRLVVIGGVEPW